MRTRGRGTSSEEPGDHALENDGGTNETAGDGNARFAAEEIGKVGYVRRVAGSGNLQIKVKKLLKSANASSGRDTKHGDAERQPVPDGAHETSRESNSANADSVSGWSGTRLRLGETNTGKESCGSGRQDAHDSEAEKLGYTDGA